MQGVFAALLVIVLQTLVPHGQPMREINFCEMMLVMMLLLFLLLFFAFAVAVAGGFFCLSSFLWGRRVWIRKTLSIDFFFVCWMLPLLWRKLACRIPVASGIQTFVTVLDTLTVTVNHAPPVQKHVTSEQCSSGSCGQ